MERNNSKGKNVITELVKKKNFTARRDLFQRLKANPMRSRGIQKIVELC